MITIKKQHNGAFNDLILLKQYSSAVRFAYNRFQDNPQASLSQVEAIVKSMNNIDRLDASFIKCAVKTAHAMPLDRKVIFGGKKQFYLRKFNKPNTFSRTIPIDMRGSSSDKNGNRKACLDIANDRVLFRPKRGIEYALPLKLSKRQRILLQKLQQGCEVGIMYFNIKVDKTHTWISFDETKLAEQRVKPVAGRVMGIDLNPNYVGLSVRDGDTTIHKELYDMKALNATALHWRGKKRHELAELAKRVVRLCAGYGAGVLALEDIVMLSSDKGKGKRYNRIVNNDWSRRWLVWCMRKEGVLAGVRVVMINPYYTSFMGQMKHGAEYDSVAASMEVAHRGAMMVRGENVHEYVREYLGSPAATRWKEMLPGVVKYEDVYDWHKKNPRSSYRVLFTDSEREKWSCSRLWFWKSGIDVIQIC